MRLEKMRKTCLSRLFFLFDLEEITFRLQTRHVQIAIKVRDLRSCRYLSNYISIIRFAPNDRWHDANAFFFRQLKTKGKREKLKEGGREGLGWVWLEWERKLFLWLRDTKSFEGRRRRRILSPSFSICSNVYDDLYRLKEILAFRAERA